jgi:hypothetical protein
MKLASCGTRQQQLPFTMYEIHKEQSNNIDLQGLGKLKLRLTNPVVIGMF